jgi:CubicO group peptidase (beta-lactamase class C family)
VTATAWLDGLRLVDEVVAAHVARGAPPAAVWLVDRGGDVHVGAAGTITGDGHGAPVGPDTIFRLSSMTKPVTAVAALVLVEDGRLALDDAIDTWLPELADRRVLARPEAPLTDTVPARRPITVRDVITFRLGWGMDFAAPWEEQTTLAAMGELGIAAGPPAPASHPETDEWLRRLGTLPLAHQPGERWLYHTGAQVLGALVGRAAGQPFADLLRERIFDPLGMVDTGFWVPPDRLDRFGPCFATDPGTGARTVYDPVEGQWSRPPAFADGGDGLVSTLRDYHAFARMLRAGGTLDGRTILDRSTVEAMTTDQLTDEQRQASGPDPSAAVGWGLGVAVHVRRHGTDRSAGSYGWDGGLGSSWANDPAEDLIGILLTDEAWTSPLPPPVCDDFWTAAYAAIP